MTYETRLFYFSKSHNKMDFNNLLSLLLLCISMFEKLANS